MVAVIVMIDQFLWRPAIAWSDKFKFEQVESRAAGQSAILNLLRRSPLLNRLRDSVMEPLAERVYLRTASHPSAQPDLPDAQAPKLPIVSYVVSYVVGAVLLALVGWGVL